MSMIDNAISQFEDNVQEMVQIIDGLTQDQIDWKMIIPLGDDYWSVREIVAHVEEVNYFWPDKIKGLIADPTGRCDRTPAELEDRLEAVAKAKDREWPELYESFKKSVGNMCQALSDVTDEQFGIMLEPAPGYTAPLAFIINHVYPEHVEEHIKHIQRQLFAYSQYH